MLRICRIGVASLALSSMWMAGCVVQPYPYHRRVVYVEPAPVVVEPAPVVVEPAPAPIVVDVAPPPPQVEVIPPEPGPEVIWMPGYWYWEGGRYVWRGGYYAHRPHPGAVWIAPRWERGRDGRWQHVPGNWR